MIIRITAMLMSPSQEDSLWGSDLAATLVVTVQLHFSVDVQNPPSTLSFFQPPSPPHTHTPGYHFKLIWCWGGAK